MSVSGINKAILVGYVGQTPELRYTIDGQAIVKVSLATSELCSYDKNGNRDVKTEWHRLVLFDQIAESAGKSLKKGAQVYVEGKIHTRKWLDKTKQEHYSTEILVKPRTGRLLVINGESTL